ncbi:DNA polymerase III subunit beta [Gracilibacillus halophilus YIM-C55.5]|uniref:Beta sliding clamp n=1 Tax=Gracilibacillus halophilus YIM-C55.5 TaxID=1308866 RepID=N4WQQ0_9BACI|nr:DNA polymerase III subunit beta [Gracilibacillus halophilus]ENH98452.1 DNA polymerase III subunit beta [Gracilibacillus halophilus YIM-C55.5]
MKIVINQDKLINSIQNVTKAISSKTAIPILAGLKIQADHEGVTLTGSNSDITIESFIPKEEEGIQYIDELIPGEIIVHASYFPDIIRKLPSETVEIEVDEQLQVTIRSGNSEFDLNGQDAEEYPQLPKIQTDSTFELPINLLKHMIKQTVFAVSTSETRPILTGVNLKVENNELHFIATDSHRLAASKLPLSIDQEKFPFEQIVIPGKSLNELNKILDETDETIQISVTDNQIIFQTEHLFFLSRLLDGKYPETSRLIPEESKTIIYAQTKNLLQAVDRASLLARENHNNVIQLQTIDDKTIEVTSNSPEIGKVEEDVTINQIDGEELKISFSSKYMIDALKIMDTEQVKIEFTGAMRPFIIKPTDHDQLLQLILPVRTF